VGGGWGTPAFAKPALVEVTGQTTSFADGDDGDIQAGVPFPTPRFTDKGNGTVKYSLTNLTWLKNANSAGSLIFKTVRNISAKSYMRIVTRQSSSPRSHC
jgi:hypothetical protein